jgi:hypothetical protein
VEVTPVVGRLVQHKPHCGVELFDLASCLGKLLFRLDQLQHGLGRLDFGLFVVAKDAFQVIHRFLELPKLIVLAALAAEFLASVRVEFCTDADKTQT